ncbi:hypothetical protein ACM64Y_04250 [Novispirillum sp. DQ9]|uniref:hypothetical protein n=1 Tax=Novispirillum sp. DQ9 TaxID=3398612 RepID=UPI003C7D9AE3
MDTMLGLMLCLAVALPVLLAVSLRRQEARLRTALHDHKARLWRSRLRLAALTTE